ncbi:MAG: TIGR02186 family protein [Mangrovicoccus sp.]
MTRLFAIIALIGLAWSALAEEVVLGLSQEEVGITATFDGSSILIFGAIKRDAPPPEEPPLHVVITVAGPVEPVTIRRKSRVMGVWANTQAIEVSQAPSFYAVASTGPLSEALSQTENLRHKVTLARTIRAMGATEDASDPQNFLDALVRIRDEAELYQIQEGGVVMDEQTLFRTSINLPANLVEGDYPTRIFLTRGGEVQDVFVAHIDVRKVGIERWLFALAHEQPLIYGLMSLVIAVIAGYGASAAFTALRR